MPEVYKQVFEFANRESFRADKGRPAREGERRIERRLRLESGFTPVAMPPAEQTTWTDSGLPERTLGSYRLWAFNDAGEGGPAEKAAHTLPKSPETPAPPSA